MHDTARKMAQELRSAQNTRAFKLIISNPMWSNYTTLNAITLTGPGHLNQAQIPK